MRLIDFFVLTSFACTTVPASALTVDEALDTFDATVSSIRSFDVFVKNELTFRFTSVPNGTINVKGKEFPKRVWKKRSEPIKRVRYSRQILSRDERRRYDVLLSEAGVPIESKVFTGEFTRHLFKKTNRGLISDDRVAFGGNGESYTSLYRETWNAKPLVSVLRTRNNLRLVPSATSQVIVLESAPEFDYTKPDPKSGYRITLDPDHGMMPRLIEVFSQPMGHPDHRCEIQEFLRLENGAWVPVKAFFQSYIDATPSFSAEMTIDVKRSRWNVDLENELFSLPFPEGTRVLDETRDIAFVAGPGDPGAHVDRLIARARDIVELDEKGVVKPKQPARYRGLIWVSIGILPIVVLALLLSRRKRRKRGQ